MVALSRSAAGATFAVTAAAISALLEGADAFLAGTASLRSFDLTQSAQSFSRSPYQSPFSNFLEPDRAIGDFNMQTCHVPVCVSLSSHSSCPMSRQNDEEQYTPNHSQTEHMEHCHKRGGISKLLKSTGAALAWYLASTTVALAVEAAATTAPLPFRVRRHRRFSLFAPVLYLYVFSNSTIKKRNK